MFSIDVLNVFFCLLYFQLTVITLEDTEHFYKVSNFCLKGDTLSWPINIYFATMYLMDAVQGTAGFNKPQGEREYKEQKMYTKSVVPSI